MKLGIAADGTENNPPTQKRRALPPLRPRNRSGLVRGEYIREAKKYITYKYDDVNHERLLSGDKRVIVDFIF